MSDTNDTDVLPPVDPTAQALAAFSATEAALAELEARAKETTYDCTTTAGDKIARQDRMKLVQLRTALDARRLEVKRPLLAAANSVDELARNIRNRILAIEFPIDAAIKAQEEARERVRIQRENAERARIKAQDAQLTAITMLPVGMVGRSAADIEQAIAQLQTAEHTWDEDYADRGATAIATTTGSLQGLLDAARQREEEAAKMAAERAENERIAAEARERAEQRERAAKARQDYINGIDRIPLDVDRDDAGKIHEAIEALRARDFDRDAPGTAEDLQAITEARTRALSKLVSMHGAAIERAEERAREAADREQRDREAAEREAAAAHVRRADRILASFNDLQTRALGQDAAFCEEAAAEVHSALEAARDLPAEQFARAKEAAVAAIDGLASTAAHHRSVAQAAADRAREAAEAEARRVQAEQDAQAERDRQEAEQAAAAQAAAEAHEAEIEWALELLDLQHGTDITGDEVARLRALIRKLAGRTEAA